MNTQQHVNEQNDIIEFQIETLEGNEFSVSIQKSEAEKVYTGSGWLHEHAKANPYDSYGLDFLKTAISKRNGVDSVTMQLFTSQGELTTATPLLPLQNQVLSLIIKSPITVTLKNRLEKQVIGESFGLYASLNFLKGPVVYTAPTVCFIHIPGYEQEIASSPVTTIQATGLEKDFFKISIKNLPYHLLRDSNWTTHKEFRLRSDHPNYLWLRFDKLTMTID